MNKDLLLKSILQIVLVELEQSKRPSKAIKWIHEEYIQFSDTNGLTFEQLKTILNIK